MALSSTSPITTAQTPVVAPTGDGTQNPEQKAPQLAPKPTPGGSLKEQVLNAADGLLEQGSQLAGITTFQKPANHFERVRIAYDVFQALSKGQDPELAKAFVDGLEAAGASLGLNFGLSKTDAKDGTEKPLNRDVSFKGVDAQTIGQARNELFRQYTEGATATASSTPTEPAVPDASQETPATLVQNEAPAEPSDQDTRAGLNQLLQAVDTQDNDRLSADEIKAAGEIEVPQGMTVDPQALPVLLEQHREEHEGLTGQPDVPIDAAIESIMRGLPAEPAADPRAVQGFIEKLDRDSNGKIPLAEIESMFQALRNNELGPSEAALTTQLLQQLGQQSPDVLTGERALTVEEVQAHLTQPTPSPSQQ